jgi:hypothetical protein
MRDMQKFAQALRRLAEGSPNREASCPLGNGLRITLKHEDTVTGERIFQLSAARYHVAPLPEDLTPIAEAFAAAPGAEWTWHSYQKNGGQYHTAWCRWHERCDEQRPERAA